MAASATCVQLATTSSSRPRRLTANTRDAPRAPPPAPERVRSAASWTLAHLASSISTPGTGPSGTATMPPVTVKIEGPSPAVRRTDVVVNADHISGSTTWAAGGDLDARHEGKGTERAVGATPRRRLGMARASCLRDAPAWRGPWMMSAPAPRHPRLNASARTVAPEREGIEFLRAISATASSFPTHGFRNNGRCGSRPGR